MVTAVVVMGVAGCGKSTVGLALAQRLKYLYVEGDELHDPASIEKMSSGQSLTDSDRWPWLQRVGKQLSDNNKAVVISCSALKRAYRDVIRQHAGKPVLFLHLSAPQSVIADRMQLRTGHFMPPELLASQFQTLEPLQADEAGAEIDITQSLEDSIASACKIVEQYSDE